MTADEIKEFHRNYKRICFIKSEITDSERGMRKLCSWDKDDSHKQAILRHIESHNKLKEKYREALMGNTKDEWSLMSKKLSKIKSCITSAKKTKSTIKQAITIAKWEQELDNLKF